MSLEAEIKRVKEEIEKIEEEIETIDSELEELEDEKSGASNKAMSSVAMMANKVTKAYGVYGYTSNTAKAGAISGEISSLEDRKDELEHQLYVLEEQLELLEQEFEYESRPEAKLVVTEEGIFIEGDDKKRNIVSCAEVEIDSYIENYNKILNSDDVARYQNLDKEVANFVQRADLPEATEQNIRRLDIVKRRHNVFFDHVVVDGKILIDRDFVTPVVEFEKGTIDRYEDVININKQKKGEFKPTALGRIFKGVGKKQQAKFDSELKKDNALYESLISDVDSKISELETAKEVFVIPSLPIMPKVHELIILCASKEVKSFVYELPDFEKNIREHTILKNIVKGDIVSRMIEESKRYLDANHLKLSREQVINAICSGIYREDLIIEIMNQLDIQPEGSQKEIPSKASVEQEQSGNAKQL